MKRGFFLTIHVAFVCVMLLCVNTISAQLTVNNAVNAADGVPNVLLGAGVTVTNINFSGTPEQIGSFNCTGGCNLNLGSGLVIGSGNIDQTPGNSGGTSSAGPSSGFGASDLDLVELSGNTLNDAAVLQFDFVATGSSISFNFVFGSEEYPEFVNGGYNDAFGFFLSGPGITGPYLNNAANIALIPNTTTPVTIDNVNSGLNSAYYINNNNTIGNNNVIECDGFTTVLTASADVQCGQTYHIKIAIADAGDTGYDSFVFLGSDSFTSSNLSATLTSPNLAPPGGGLYEGCQAGSIVFNVPEQTIPQIFQLAYTGTAQYGIDYDSIPTQITFPANQSQLVISIDAIADGILEGSESLTVTILGATSCGQNVDVDVVISDLPGLVVNTPDVPINCGQQAVLSPNISGGLGNYVVHWLSGPTSPTYTVSPSVPTSYSFTVTDTCGVAPYNGVANVVFIDNPPLLLSIGPDQALTCLDDVNMSASVSGGFGTYDYAWTSNGVPIGSSSSIAYSTNNATQIILTVTDDCGESISDLANVTFPPVPMTANLGPDMAVTCIEENLLQPTVTGGVGTYTYSWSTQAGNLGNGNTLLFQTDEDVSVAVTVQDECGNSDTDEISIAVPQVAMTSDIGNDLTITCIDAIPVSANVAGGVGNYSYTWNLNNVVVGSGQTYTVVTDNDGALTLTVTDQCGNSTTDNIDIDVPPVPIAVDAGNNLTVTCLDNSTLTATVNGGVGTYSYQWLTGLTNLGTQASINYQTDQNQTVTLVVTDQCGNTNTDVLTIDVPPVPVNADAGSDISVTCLDVSPLAVQANGGVGTYSYQWSNGINTIGLNATVNYQAANTQTITVVVIDQCGNTDTDQLTIDVPPVPVFAYAGEDMSVTCIDISILSGSATGGVGTYAYQWTDADGAVGGSANVNYQADANSIVVLTVTDQCGNTDVDDVLVEVPAVPVVLVASNDTIICLGESATFYAQATGGVTDITYEWDLTPENNFSQYTVYPTASQAIPLMAYDECGNSASTTVYVTVLDVYPSFIAEYVDDNTVQFTNLTPDADVIEWIFNDGTTSTELNPVHTFLTANDWQATLVATVEPGCSRTISQDYQPMGAIFVPNCFTPDNDGVNDFLFVEGHDIAKFEWSIYNRWGEKIYTSTDMSMPWDGSYKNGEYYVPDGVYQYQIVAWGERNNIIEKQGSVLIIR